MLNAVSLLEEFVESGDYREWKQAEHELSIVRNEFKRFLKEDEMRRDFSQMGINLVAKYRRIPVYEVDHEGLNRYLHENYGLLIPVSTLDTGIRKDNPELWEALGDYQLPNEWYVRFTPNKAGRAEKEDVDYSLNLRELSNAFYDLSERVESYKKTYEDIREKLMKDKELQLSRKVQTKFGSVSMQAKRPEFDMKRILQEYGEDFLIHHARVRMKELDHFIERGYIRKHETDQFRKVTDIRLAFIVQKLDAEQRQLEMLDRRTNRMVEALRGIG
ncbi:hypothetical protein [Novibacillus thermophilus]|uniref:Uncharacterized protein n=1 Tax=Novibacillus thermophilus TaxID=1471761 RepID=A0A1U9K6N3_9BACL|nr:hypothetical protein [Novibacillus thermophilus]AQS55694.1 hypothetical protein B0W44_07720 [Novibacillus thermophilus]